MMRATLSITGGFAAIPGLRRTPTVHASTLPGEQRDQLEALVADRTIFDAVAPHAAVRDARSYVLTVDDGDSRRTVRSSDPVVDQRLRALRDLISGHGAPSRSP